MKELVGLEKKLADGSPADLEKVSRFDQEIEKLKHLTDVENNSRWMEGSSALDADVAAGRCERAFRCYPTIHSVEGNTTTPMAASSAAAAAVATPQ